LFYSNYQNKYVALVNAQKKVTAMTKKGILKRKRNNINSKYYYYLDKEPKQLQHNLLRTELYVRLCQLYGIDNISIETKHTMEGCWPDAYISIKHGKRLYMFYVEVHISNNQFNIEKYETLDKAAKNNIFPYLLIITDKQLQLKTNLEYYVIPESMEDLKSILPIGKSIFNVR